MSRLNPLWHVLKSFIAIIFSTSAISVFIINLITNQLTWFELGCIVATLLMIWFLLDTLVNVIIPKYIVYRRKENEQEKE